jgi:hypothetical protein
MEPEPKPNDPPHDPQTRARDLMRVAEEVIDRSRNLRHLVMLRRVLRNLGRRLPDDPPAPPTSH